jgi:tetratricopeptide (TPR) repeat protein/pimeloyl-ACP methyl ester carboxylesterase
MRVHEANEFTPMPDDEEPLVVHRHAGPEGATGLNIVIFVHGLGGDRYGTWGEFPAYLFKDLQKLGVDIALYAYHTLWKRFGLTASIELEQEADIFADVLRDLPKRYGRIVLIGHSMGGLLAKAAIKSLIDRDNRAALQRIAGLVLMATPQTGSLKMPGFLGALSADARALKPHGAFVTRLVETFQIRVNATPAPDGSGRFHIPAWAVIAPADQWVDRLSAGLAIPDDHTKKVRGSHTSIVKPSHQGNDAYEFVRNALERCFAPPAGPVNAQPAAPAALSAVPSSSPFADFGFPAPVMSATSTLAVSQAAQRPPLDELFEVITDPDDVLDALFHTEQSDPIRPSSVDYIPDREGTDDVQEAIAAALREAAGRLLICGREGIGKTREIAEYARAACAKNWKVLRARSDRDALLGPVPSLPASLIDSHLLILVDNLHSRILGGADQEVPYAERLEQLLRSLDRHLPGDVRALVTTRDEPYFQQQVGYRDDEQRWRSFGLFRLPQHTEKGLQQMLTALAERAGVAVDPADVPKLIENSDRKPETIFINVNEARRKETPLTAHTWWPSEGESWRDRFISARGKHAGVERIAQALRLLQEIGLPARVPYVAAVARAAGEPDPHSAINVLLDIGLLGSRRGRLAPFSAEQLGQQLGSDAKLNVADYREALETAIRANAPDVAASDLVALAIGLLGGKLAKEADEVASDAIGLAGDHPRAFRVRAYSRFQMQRLAEAETDLSKALEIEDDTDTRFMRGTIRNMLIRSQDAIEDLDAAIRQGRDDASVYVQRSGAHLALGLLPQAEADQTAAIERGETAGMAFFMRGIIRQQLHDFAGAEADFTVAIERGTAMRKFAAAIQDWSFNDAPAVPAAPEGEQAYVRALRGLARLVLERWPEAEEDFTAAIDGNAAGEVAAMVAATAKSSIPMMEKAAAEFKRGGDLGPMLYAWRAATRLRQNRLKEANDDFDAAEAKGLGRAELNNLRGQALAIAEQYAEADQCLTVAIDGGKGDMIGHSLRGFARLELGRPAEAEQDFDAAARLGRNDVWLHFNRGRALRSLDRYADAERELDAVIASGMHNAGFFSARAELRGAQEKWAAAEEDYRSAIAAGRDDAGVRYLLASTLSQQGRYAEAESELDSALKLADDSDLREFRGRVRLLQNNPAGAIEEFDAVLAKEPKDAETLRLRGIARYVQRDWTGALRDYESAAAVSPDVPDIRGACVMARLQIGDLDDAARDCAEIEKIDRKGSETSGYYGALHLVRGDADAALPRLAAAAEADRNWYGWLGIAWLMKGETEKARDVYRREAQHRSPADNVIRRHDLELCVARHPERFAAAEVQAALAAIRAELA